MGPTSAGKTTIGSLLTEELRASDLPAIHYDGDEIRSFFNNNLGFRAEDRLQAVSVCVHLANKATNAGVNAIVSALTANEDARAYVRNKIPNLVLVYLRCPISVCIERDSKDLYRRAKEGVIDANTVIGLTTPYNDPCDPSLVIDTSKSTPKESVSTLVSWLRANLYL